MRSTRGSEPSVLRDRCLGPGRLPQSPATASTTRRASSRAARRSVGGLLARARPLRHELGNDRVLSRGSATARCLPVATLNPVAVPGLASRSWSACWPRAPSPCGSFPTLRAGASTARRSRSMRSAACACRCCCRSSASATPRAIGAATAGHGAPVVLAGAPLHAARRLPGRARTLAAPVPGNQPPGALSRRSRRSSARWAPSGCCSARARPPDPFRPRSMWSSTASIADERQTRHPGGQRRSRCSACPRSHSTCPPRRPPRGSDRRPRPFRRAGPANAAVSPHEQIADADRTRHCPHRRLVSARHRRRRSRGQRRGASPPARDKLSRVRRGRSQRPGRGPCSAMDAAYAERRRRRQTPLQLRAISPPPAAPASTCCDAVAERGRPLLIHVDGPDWDAALGDVAPRVSELEGHRRARRARHPGARRRLPRRAHAPTSTSSCQPRFRICPSCARSCGASVPTDCCSAATRRCSTPPMRSACTPTLVPTSSRRHSVAREVFALVSLGIGVIGTGFVANMHLAAIARLARRPPGRRRRRRRPARPCRRARHRRRPLDHARRRPAWLAGRRRLHRVHAERHPCRDRPGRRRRRASTC